MKVTNKIKAVTSARSVDLETVGGAFETPHGIVHVTEQYGPETTKYTLVTTMNGFRYQRVIVTEKPYKTLNATAKTFAHDAFAGDFPT